MLSDHHESNYNVKFFVAIVCVITTKLINRYDVFSIVTNMFRYDNQCNLLQKICFLQ
jgi:hypothetical protein